MTRAERLARLLEDHGCATECHVARPGGMPRYALMQADEGPADNGGPWWDFGDDWRQLVDESANQEYPEDWPAELLVDLDSGHEWECQVDMTVHVVGLAGGPLASADLVAQDRVRHVQVGRGGADV